MNISHDELMALTKMDPMPSRTLTGRYFEIPSRFLAWLRRCPADQIIARQPIAEQRTLRAINRELAAR